MRRSETAARYHECDVTVGKRNGGARADRRTLARPKFDRVRRPQVGSGVTGVRIAGHVVPEMEYFYAFGHLTRLVQNDRSPEKPCASSGPPNIWCNGGMTIYRERLWAAPWVFLATALVIPAALLVFLPINAVVGIVTAIVLYAVCVVLLIVASPVVAVTGDQLLAGGARLPLQHVGDTASYRRDAATLERGQRLDARAWLLLRGWIDPVLKVELDDPEDPTPYWLISTRQPERLAKAIADARATAKL